MYQIIQKILTKIVAFWQKKNVSANNQGKKEKTKKQRRSKEHFGAHYYFGDLLDKIDEAFEGMKILKKADRATYRVFSKISCHVHSGDYKGEMTNAFAIRPDQIPLQGCVYLGDGQKDDGNFYPMFSFFRRIKNPINVQPTNDVVLEVGQIFNTPEDSFAVSYYVGVSHDCTIYPLKQMRQEKIPVGFKEKRKGRKRAFLVRGKWEYSDILQTYCKNNGLEFDDFLKICWVPINMVLSNDSGVNVRVSKGLQSLTFAIDMLRTPYFFKDRNKTVNENGNTKKIFHIVAAHERTVAGGEKKQIKSHFRGLRKFMWNGYKVNVFLHEKHVRSLNRVNTDLTQTQGNQEPIGDYVHESVSAERLAKLYDTV
jgi:hypothetical protein